MSFDKYINMMLTELSEKYQLILIEVKTYKHNQKYSSFKLTVYKYIIDENGEEDKQYYKTIETSSKKEMLLKIKEMM